MRDEGHTKGVNLYSLKDFHFFLTLLYVCSPQCECENAHAQAAVFYLSCLKTNVGPSSCNNSAASPPPIRLGVLADNVRRTTSAERKSIKPERGGMTGANGPTA